MAFMNCVYVFLQSACLRKWFATKFTVVIFMTFMNCVSSNFLLERKIYHKIHICSLCGLHELCRCVSSKCLPQKNFFYKIYICNLYDLHELCFCVSSNFLLKKMIYRNKNLLLLWMVSLYKEFVVMLANKMKYSNWMNVESKVIKNTSAYPVNICCCFEFIGCTWKKHAALYSLHPQMYFVPTPIFSKVE